MRGLRGWRLRWLLPPLARKRGVLGLPDLPGAPWQPSPSPQQQQPQGEAEPLQWQQQRQLTQA